MIWKLGLLAVGLLAGATHGAWTDENPDVVGEVLAAKLHPGEQVMEEVCIR